MCFRNAPTNQQIGAAANRYVVDVLKRKKVAVISDTSVFGTASVNTYVPMLKALNAEVVYQGDVDTTNPDLTPEILRMRNAGAEAIMPWSVNPGFLSRIINTRGQMQWDVPIVGQTTLGSGQTLALLEKPEYWAKVYPNNFRPVCYNADGKLTDRTAAFLERLKSAKIEVGERCCGGSRSAMTAVHDREGDKSSGAEPNRCRLPQQMKDTRSSTATSPSRPNVTMATRTSGRHGRGQLAQEGAFKLAPGYGA